MRELVYGEAEPTDVEAPINNQVIFDIPDTDAYRSYTSESEFQVQRKYSERAIYYYKLTLIQSPPLN